MDENLVEKTLKNLRAESIDETILDELQSKVFELLSSDKYYGQFKTTPQYLKVLSEIDPNDSLNDNSGLFHALFFFSYKNYSLFIPSKNKIFRCCFRIK